MTIPPSGANTNPPNSVEAMQIETTLPASANEVLIAGLSERIVIEAGKEPPKKVTIRRRCEFEGCSRRIRDIERVIHTCACDKVFCQKHLFSSNHNCTFDYKARDRARLKRKLMGEPTSKKGSAHQYYQYHKPEGNSSY